MIRNTTISLAFLGILALAGGCQQPVDEGQATSDMTDSCDPTLMCGAAMTCVDGHWYRTTCGPANCDEPLGPCGEPECDPTLMCGEAMTCIDGQWYPTTCGPDNCDEPLGPCTDKSCGGLAGLQCDAGELCEYTVGCGLPDEMGTCTPMPDTCPKNIDPVCGCDDLTYDNECFAHMDGVGVHYQGQCEPTAS